MKEDQTINRVFIRFYEELNDFLPVRKRKNTFPVSFREHETIKSIIESEGVPHTEVDLILINGRPASFTDRPGNGDLVSVYPVFETFDISGIGPAGPKPLRDPKFILDVHLGKLTRYLRMLGFDSAYDNNYVDDDLVAVAMKEKRTLLTRDRNLLMRKNLTRGYWIRSEMIFDQVSEVLRRFDLIRSVNLFSKCTLCNGDLQAEDENKVALLFPDYKFSADTRFFRCRDCGHIYWNGSHSSWFEKSMTEMVINNLQHFGNNHDAAGLFAGN
jgi:uncharacterized protein with PIN domain